MGRQAALIPPFSLRRRPFPNGRAVWAKSELFAASPALFSPCSLSERAASVGRASVLTISERTGRACSPKDFLTVRN